MNPHERLRAFADYMQQLGIDTDWASLMTSPDDERLLSPQELIDTIRALENGTP